MDEPGSLFGLPGAETMRDSLEDVYNLDIEPSIEWDSDAEWIIEEWTSKPAREFGPRPEYVAGYVAEHLADEMGGDWEMFEQAATAPEVIGLFAAAIGALADRVGWRMADVHVASYAVSWDAEGLPLLNGNPWTV